MKKLDLVYATMLAELGQRSLDGAFATDFPLEGNFVSESWSPMSAALREGFGRLREKPEDFGLSKAGV